MDGELWLEKYEDNPLTEQFIKQFGGNFIIDSEDDIVFYETGRGENYKAFQTPENEITFWNMVSQSVKQNKNLFLDQPQFQSHSPDLQED